MLLSKKFSRFKGNPWNVVLVTGGSVLGQGIVILAMPFITRLYTPEQMGIYALFVSIFSIFSIIIALHYELAIPLPASDKDSLTILSLGIWVTLIFSIVIGIMAFICRSWIIYLTKAPQIGKYFILIPFSLMLSGAIILLTTWAIKKKAYNVTAVSKSAKGFGQVIPQLAGGYLGFGVTGLVVGQITGQVASLAALWRATKGYRKKPETNLQSLWEKARQYRKFAMITTCSSLINALSAHLPVIMLTSFFGADIAGLFALSYRALQMPMRFLGASISQVFFSMASEGYRSGNLANVTWKVFRAVFAFSLPTFFFIACLSPWLFKVAFGNQWEQAGVFTQLLAPWLLFSFITTPLSILVSVVQEQKKEFFFQIAYLACFLCSMIIGRMAGEAKMALGVLGVFGGTLLIVKTFWMLSISGIRFLKFFRFMCTEGLLNIVPFGGAFWMMQHIAAPEAGVALCSLIFLLIHFYNFKIRNLYGFNNARQLND
ncbi:MAG: oligosaccharide flippase family protein [Desulfobacteraceae bacterium]|nr:oligosaccharide flippase family protein [Desulfobacteraceae bacterium]